MQFLSEKGATLETSPARHVNAMSTPCQRHVNATKSSPITPRSALPIDEIGRPGTSNVSCTSDDPKIWCFKVFAPGQDVCLSVLTKAGMHSAKGKSCPIWSAFYNPSLPGYICAFCEDIEGFHPRYSRLVPLAQIAEPHFLEEFPSRPQGHIFPGPRSPQSQKNTYRHCYFADDSLTGVVSKITMLCYE